MSCPSRLFVNRKAFPGVGMIMLKEDTPCTSETVGQVSAVYNLNQELIGYNILSPYFEALKDGYCPWTEEVLTFVNGCLTKAGFEVLQPDLSPKIIVGYVVSCDQHPDSDHLHVCQVDIGSETKQIVCGAANVAAGQKVVVALENAVLPDGKLITASELRGVASAGMLCSEWELCLIEEPKRGILVLDDQAAVGSPFFGR